MMNTKFQKAKRPFAVAAALGMAGLMSQAHAETVSTCPDLRCQTYAFLGSDSESFALNLNAPGTMTVSLTDAMANRSLPNFSALDSLSFMVASGTQVLWSSLNATSDSFALPAGTYTGLINVSSGNPNQWGVMSLNIKFSPLVTPIPAGLWLLISGAMGLVGLMKLFNRSGRITMPDPTAAAAH